MAWRPPGVSEIGRLGSGATGRVVSAVHKATGTYVAVKYLADRLRLDGAFLAEYRDIVTVLAGLDDPHLARVYEYVETPQGTALVMEHIDGVTLGELIAAGRLEPIAALRVYRAVLRGLGTLHDQGITHDDVKPGNIMLDGSGLIKITDVGLSGPPWPGALAPGSPQYLAPERWAGEPAHPTSDIYAATAVFVHAIQGRPPYGPGTREAHRSGPLPSVSIPEALRPLVAKGLAKNADDRPYDANAFADAVTALADREFGVDWDEHAKSALARRIAPVLAAVQNTSTDSGLGDVVAGLADRPLATRLLATGIGASVGVMLFSAFTGGSSPAIAGLAEPSFTLDLPSQAPAPAPTGGKPTGGPKPGATPAPTPTPVLIPLNPNPNPTPLPTTPVPGPHPTTPTTQPGPTGGGGGGGNPTPTHTTATTPGGGGGTPTGGGGGTTPPASPTPTDTSTPDPTPTETPTPTPTDTPTPTPTPTDTSTPDPTPTDTPSDPPSP